MKYCIYCGEIAEARDHVVPVSYSQTSRYYRRGTTVPSCAECNNLLGSISYHTVEERTQYLFKRYTEKFKDLLQLCLWSEAEINELGTNLQCKLQERNKKKELYIKKLEVLSTTFEPVLTPDSKTVNCLQCKKSFPDRGNKKYCSINCKSMSMKMIRQHSNCLNCKIPLTHHVSSAKYCSTICKNAAYRAKRGSASSF